MWVILVNSDLSSHRENYINVLLEYNNSGLKEEYLMNPIGRKYFTSTSYIKYAKIYKNRSGAEKTINLFNKGYDKFKYLKGKHLSCRKLSIDEWNSSIDNEISDLNRKYQRDLSKIESKKFSYK